MSGRPIILLLAASGILSACASQECDFNSQCGEGWYCQFGRCRQDCRNDLDCDDGLVCDPVGRCVSGFDGGPTPDAGTGEPVDAGTVSDAGRPNDAGGSVPADAGGVDAGGSVGRDAGPPPPLDSGAPTGTGRYLDRCLVDGDCSSGRCVDDVGGTRMCSIACSAHSDCVGEHVCDASGACVRDDTGTTCSLSAPDACRLGLCFGNSVAGIGQCTRDCSDAGECPAGYACVDAGASFRVCAEIERPCTSATDCGTGICIPGLGCTSECRSAADCPGRFSFAPAYTCGVGLGSSTPICLPPSDIMGPDAIGTPCSILGDATCRSGPLACDATPLGNLCTQACTDEGGCAAGLGCFPSVEDLGTGLEIVPLCTRAGSKPIGAACANGRECDSGMCDSTLSSDMFCTRVCTADAVCPTGMTCRPISGFGVSVCRR